MHVLIENIARALVDYPDDVEVFEEPDDDGTVYVLRVADPDLGKVIGRRGKTASAIRTLMGAAAARQGVRVSLDIDG